VHDFGWRRRRDEHPEGNDAVYRGDGVDGELDRVHRTFDPCAILRSGSLPDNGVV
jgi:hypothetical protein